MGLSSDRPISDCLDIDPNSEGSARLFRCPADVGGHFSGGAPIEAYQYYGNSYQANPWLLWRPPAFGAYADLSRSLAKLQPFTQETVEQPSRLLFYGDCDWVTQWESSDLSLPRLSLNAQIEKGAEDHIPADPRKSVNVQQSHCGRLQVSRHTLAEPSKPVKHASEP